MANECCIGPIFFIIGLAMIYEGTRRFLLYQKINNTPTSKVRAAAIGLVELFGKAECREDMQSPVSGVRCAYWRLKCEYYVPGKHGGWRDMYNSHSSSKFFLEDETGKMLIEPDGAEIDIPPDYTSQGYLSPGGILGLMQRKTLDQKVFAFLERDPAAKAAFNSHSGYDQKVTESFIATDDPLYVLGTAVSWKEAELIVQKGKDGIMYISDSGERKAAEKVRNSVFWILGIGLVLSAIGLYVLLTSFGV
ncbi:MAG: GIDE domain-containing protein [Candidatus Micrarchaeia archaeon]